MTVQSKIPAQDQSLQDKSATALDDSEQDNSSRTRLENVPSDQKKDNVIHLSNNETKNKAFSNCDNFQPNKDSTQKRKQNMSDLHFGR